MFVIATMVIAVIVLNIFVIPAFAEVFAKYGADLPWQTQLIITISDAFVRYWFVAAAVIVVSSYAVFRYLQTKDGRLRWH